MNEETLLKGAISSVLQRGVSPLTEDAPCGVEVIVVDGGSSDNTLASARLFGVEVISSVLGRGAQMDKGARIAKGEVLLFLHADTLLPEGWLEAVIKTLKDKKNIAGSFTLQISAKGFWFRVIEKGILFRSRVLGLVFGDQAIFVRREVFDKVGGFRGLPLMEDIDIVRRLKKEGTFSLIQKEALTSSRRWGRGGFFKALINTTKNWFFLCTYFAGVSPKTLYAWYYKD
ncbi:MAG: TIGR04283 family arsenosugar biosynthesis glycosyltransferase [Deltaproteobacteria bacterium]|nr:TIGR04283 family arsenosugar biosynthesis glycosyltransferase [Deltaproteobacteria bacterium]